MLQIIQHLNSGETELLECPEPCSKKGCLILKTQNSLISTGTERSLVAFGQASYLDKARQQPEKVKMVAEKISSDGLLPTIDAVRSKLAEPIPLGYCHVGTVNSIGNGVSGFELGQRVVSNGPHAEFVRVPKNLCAAIPDNVSDSQASFTVVASIALQGIRLAGVDLGESVAVIGVGLIGLLAVQLLKAQGCRVLAIDLDDSKLALAKQFGAEVCNPRNGEDPVEVAMGFSRGVGIDAVLIAAYAKDSEPVSQAARMSRKRGRIVLVGVTGLDLNRSEFYEKELSFQVSCSYGPGRYDPSYEDQGIDYPVGYVRWTQQRNFVAVLDMMAEGLLDTESLISHRYKLRQACKAYDVVATDKSALGILLEYDSVATDDPPRQTLTLPASVKPLSQTPSVAFIGAGNYAARVLIPAFKNADAQLHTLVTTTGRTATVTGRKFGFKQASTDLDAVFDDEAVNTICIATRHDSHAELVCRALSVGKHVFVEKPLAMNADELERIRHALQVSADRGTNTHLMVGFNRRFSPLVVKMKELLDSVHAPKVFVYTVNAGSVDHEHWVNDLNVGGGRILGEACHFVDLIRFLAASPIESAELQKMGDSGVANDDVSISLKLANGSIGTINYLTNGHKSFAKERLEVFTHGRVLQMDNFRKLQGWGWKEFRSQRLWRQDKGQNACSEAFISRVSSGGQPLIPVDELFEVSEVSIRLADAVNPQSCEK